MITNEQLDRILQCARPLFQEAHRDTATGKWEIHFGTAGRTAIVGVYDGEVGGVLVELFNDEGDAMGEKVLPFEPSGSDEPDAQRLCEIITKEAAR